MDRKEQIKRIKALVDQYLEIVNSEKNKKNMKLWENPYNWNRDKWRGIAPSKTRKSIPFIADPDISLWRKVCGNTNLIDFYNDPYVHMEMQLMQKIKHFNMFDDNFVYTDELFVWFGVVTELSLFGSEIIYYEHKEGWVKEPLLKDYEDIERLSPPDFYKSGVMPKVHEFYEVLGDLAEGKLKVMFPELARGPFCIAAHLRGLENMFCDVKLVPDFAHQLMRFVVDGNKSWTEERNKFLKEEKHKCKLFNDEVDSPSISPAIYDEFILPYEKELSEHYGGISYFHSCGNITPFLPSIKKIPNLDVIHCGPWTSYEEADKIFGNETALEICLHPMKDVLTADEDQMRKKLEDIIGKCKHNNFAVRADTFMPIGELGEQIDNIQKWVKIAKEYLNGK